MKVFPGIFLSDAFLLILSCVQLALGLSPFCAEELVGVSSLPPSHGFQGLNSGGWVWWQAPLPAEPSHQPYLCSLLLRESVLVNRIQETIRFVQLRFQIYLPGDVSRALPFLF